MEELVSYRLDDGVATIRMDDGKRNAISPAMVRALGGALDRAQADGAVVVLTGREGVFSSGFDLKVLRGGGFDALAMLRGGFALAERLLAFPSPVVIACNGHGIAMGAFLLLSGDYRFGTRGDFKIVTNEVAIGLTMPRAGVEICRHRLAPPHFDRAVLLAETYTPETALEAGFLDRVVAAEALEPAALGLARSVLALDRKAHAETKLRARAEVLRALRAAGPGDSRDFMLMGARQVIEAKLRSRRRP